MCKQEIYIDLDLVYRYLQLLITPLTVAAIVIRVIRIIIISL